MKNKQTSKTYTTPQKIFWISLATLLSAGLVAIVVWVILLVMPPKSPAEEAGAPFTRELAAAGAVQKCKAVADGNHIASRDVGLLAYYEVPRTRDQTIKLVTDTAAKNGYSLTHASSQNKPMKLSVDDRYIDNWYFDVTSKRSWFKDLKEGPIEITVAFYNDFDQGVNCGGTTNATNIKGNDRQTVVRLQIGLPDRRD